MKKGELFLGKTIIGLLCILGCSLLVPGMGAKAASLHGKNNEEKIFFFLREEMNFNNAAGCGVLANIEKESSFRTEALSDGGTSYGICQWHADRMSRLRAWCDDHGYDWEDLEGQLCYLEYELNTYYPTTLSLVKNVSNSKSGAFSAGHDWCYYFEIPADRAERSNERGNLAADKYWPKYKKVKTKLKKGKTYVTEEGIFKATGDYEVTFMEMVNPEAAELTIPGKVTIDNVTAKVTAIAAGACEDNEILQSVTIGGNITKIGKRAFSGCTNLGEITIKSKKIKTFAKASFESIKEDAVFYVKKSVKKKYKKKLKKVAPGTIEVSEI